MNKDNTRRLGRSIVSAAAIVAPLAIVVSVGCFNQGPGTTTNPASNATPTTQATNPTTTASATPTDAPESGPPKIPATHKYYAQAYDNCLPCHTTTKPTSAGNKVPFMPFGFKRPGADATHAGRTQATCMACHSKAADQEPPVVNLTVARVNTPPTVDGSGSDGAWNSASELSIALRGGLNKSEQTIKVKAVHDGTDVYFLVTVPDPTLSEDRGSFVKNADGTWTKQSYYPDKYEDKLAIIWNNSDSSRALANFNTQGCAVTCHAVTANRDRPYKYTNAANEIADMWHAKLVRHVQPGLAPGGLGYMDDQYVFLPSDITAATTSVEEDGGRAGDPQTSSKGDVALKLNLVDGKPQFMPAGSTIKAPPFYMTATASFDDSRYVAGDKVPQIMVKPLTEGRGDIKIKAVHDGTKWVWEFKRSMVPTDASSGKDTVFEPGGTYYAGFAYFDNAQIGHSVQFGVTRVTFAQ